MKIAIRRFTILSTLLFLFTHCKKEAIDSIGGELSSPDTTEKRAYFTDTLETKLEEYKEVFVAYAAKGHFFYVIQNISGSSYRLTKCTREIDTLYSKILDLGPGQLIQVKGDLTEDAFYTLTATNKFGAFSGPSVSAYVLIRNYVDSTCSRPSQPNHYNYESEFRPEGEAWQENMSLLKKYNANGKESWRKEFMGNYFDCNAMEWAANGNLYLITSIRYPRRFKLNLTHSQSFPYYDPILDSNRCVIYALNKNGVVLRKKSLEGIYGIGSNTDSPNLSISTNHLRINNNYVLYTLDFNLNLLSSAKPIKNNCNNFLHFVVSNPLQPLAYLSGFMTYSNFNDRNYYRVHMNGTFEINPRQNLDFIPFFLQMNKRGQFYSLGSRNTVTKYDNDETILYSKLLNPDNVLFSLSRNNCIADVNDKLYCFAYENNLIKVYKLDENGNF